METKEKNNETKRRQSERRNCLQKCFHLFKYLIDSGNVPFFFLISLRTCSKSLSDINSVIPSVLLAASFSSDHFAALTGL